MLEILFAVSYLFFVCSIIVRLCVSCAGHDISMSSAVKHCFAYGSDLFHRLTVMNHLSLSLPPSFPPSLHSLSVLPAIFPREPGLANFIEAKDDGSGGDNWSHKSCKKDSATLLPPTDQHPVSTGRMPFLSPNQQRQSTEGKAVISSRKIDCLFTRAT